MMTGMLLAARHPIAFTPARWASVNPEPSLSAMLITGTDDPRKGGHGCTCRGGNWRRRSTWPSPHLSVFITTPPSVMGHVQAGKLKGLAVAGKARQPGLPQVPTTAEAGLKGFESTGWYGLYGPRAMPRPVVDTLYKTVRQMVQSKDVIERFTQLNLEAVGSTPEEFAKFLKEDYERYVAVARAAKASASVDFLILHRRMNFGHNAVPSRFRAEILGQNPV